MNIKVEEIILGSILIDKNALIDVVADLPTKAFLKEENQLIYKSILNVFSNGEPIDILTVVNDLRLKGNLAKVGGAYYISQLTQNVNSSSNLKYHIKILVQDYLKSEMKVVLGKYLDLVKIDSSDTIETLEEVTRKLILLGEEVFTEDVDTKKHTAEMLRLLDKAISSSDFSGIDTGLNVLNNHTNGFQQTDLIYIAGRPAMGKTALVLSMVNSQIEENKSVLVFSLEMGGSQLMQRLTSISSGIELERIRKGNVHEKEIELIKRTANQLSNKKLHICDIAGMSLLQMRSVANKIKHSYGLDIIYVDYLQLMYGTGGNREQEVGSNSRGLKAIAKEFNVPVVCLSQLSRNVESRGNRKPILADLRDSGSIEQDADQVYFLYRPEYYGEEFIPQDSDGNKMPEGFTELINAKNRNGATGSLFIKFDKRLTKFVDFKTVEVDFKNDEKIF